MAKKKKINIVKNFLELCALLENVVFFNDFDLKSENVMTFLHCM